MAPVKKLAKKNVVAVETTKEAFLRVAIDAIDEAGESNVRLEAILEEVGVSPSSLYHHYGNLNGLIEAAQIERFRRANLGNALEFKRRVEETETLEEFKVVIDGLMDIFFSTKRTHARMQRANALGSAFGRPELLEALGEAQREALVIGTEAMNIAKYKGFLRKNLNTAAFIAWYDSQSFGLVLVEITQDKTLAAEWKLIARQNVHAQLFVTLPTA